MRDILRQVRNKTYITNHYCLRVNKYDEFTVKYNREKGIKYFYRFNEGINKGVCMMNKITATTGVKDKMSLKIQHIIQQQL